jgi:hypothetical protein
MANKNPYKLQDFHVFKNHSEIFWHVAKICQEKKKKKNTAQNWLDTYLQNRRCRE